MIPVTNVSIGGVTLTAPIINGRVIEFPCNDLKRFADFCGPGDGIAEWLVPEDIYRTHVSGPCFIHDCMRAMIMDIPGLNDIQLKVYFNQHNRVFRDNLIAVIDAFETDDQRHLASMNRAMTYFGAVQVLGKRSFYNRYRRHYGQCS